MLILNQTGKYWTNHRLSFPSRFTLLLRQVLSHKDGYAATIYQLADWRVT